MKHATIVDIARKLGVAPSTVSRALSDEPGVRKATKEKIKKLAKELRYSPNPIARSLRSSRTTTIGVIVPEIKHDFFASAISGIEEVAYHSGYTIIVCQSNESYEREVVNTNAMMHHRVAGVIVSVSQDTKSGEHFKSLLNQKVPLVFFDRACDDVDASKVVIDDCKSAYAAVMHLIQRGYRRIAHFAGPRELGICIRRRSGYLKALQESGITLPENFVKYGGLHEEDGYRSMESMLREGVRPDAIFAVNDPVAIGAFQKIKEAGLRIPADVAIVGFSNNKITALVDPPLTTVNQPSFEMGKRAAQILVDTIKGGVAEPRTIVLETDLIVRGST